MKPSDRGPVVVRPPGSTVPIPVGRDTDMAKEAEACLETIASDMYDGDDIRFIGKSRLEATVLSLAEDAPHDSDARKEFLDRVMGKPRQRVESTTVTVDLTDYLQQLVEEEHGEVVDAEFTSKDDPEAEDGLSLLC